MERFKVQSHNGAEGVLKVTVILQRLLTRAEKQPHGGDRPCCTSTRSGKHDQHHNYYQIPTFTIIVHYLDRTQRNKIIKSTQYGLAVQRSGCTK